MCGFVWAVTARIAARVLVVFERTPQLVRHERRSAGAGTMCVETRPFLELSRSRPWVVLVAKIITIAIVVMIPIYRLAIVIIRRDRPVSLVLKPQWVHPR